LVDAPPVEVEPNPNIFNNSSSASLPSNDLNFDDGPSNAFGNVTYTEAETIASADYRDDQAFLGTLLGIAWLMFMVTCSCRRRTPGREHWRGAQIRQRYLRMREEERAKEARESLTPKERRRLVQYNIRTKRVVAKDEDGNLTLGSANSLATESGTFRPPEDQNIEEDDEEHVCVVCLDSFQVGDVICYSRFSKECHHVYHAECVQPWFEGKRMDDCPCCRCKVILEEPPIKAESVKTDNSTVIVSMGDDSEDDEEDFQADDDNFFVIARGLISRATRPISRAAKRASYTLIGSKDSMDSGDQSNQHPPTPLRRVLSHNAALSGRDRLSSVSSAASHAELLRNTSMDQNEPQSPLGRSFECNNEDLETGNPMTPLESPSPFRKVRSDVGCPSPARALRFDLPEEAQLDLSNYLAQVKPPSSSSNSSSFPVLTKRPSTEAEETPPEEETNAEETNAEDTNAEDMA